MDDDDETKLSSVVCHVGGLLVACRAVKGITTSNPLKDISSINGSSEGEPLGRAADRAELSDVSTILLGALGATAPVKDKIGVPGGGRGGLGV